jgi:KipI family sensor histidine kinase inhibitor
MNSPVIKTVGENAMMVYLGDSVSPATAARVQAAVAIIERTLAAELIDLVPSYASVMVLFDALACDHVDARRRLAGALSQLGEAPPDSGRSVTLPVYYAPEAGVDLEPLAERTGLSVDEVIALHSATEYRVYAIGFAPGFAYLGEVDARIAAPRHPTPRMRVPRGSVAIADRQTAVYPAASPGGWNLIGLCPVPMFDQSANPCMPANVGDTVRFEPVSREEFLALGGQLA